MIHFWNLSLHPCIISIVYISKWNAPCCGLVYAHSDKRFCRYDRTTYIIKVNIRNVQPTTHMLGTILFDLLVHTAPLVFRFCRFAVAELLRPKSEKNKLHTTRTCNMFQRIADVYETCLTCPHFVFYGVRERICWCSCINVFFFLQLVLRAGLIIQLEKY